ncbi:MAG: hypothetical protein ACREEW_13755 [Caulobacteraceae bacterium]
MSVSAVSRWSRPGPRGAASTSPVAVARVAAVEAALAPAPSTAVPVTPGPNAAPISQTKELRMSQLSDLIEGKITLTQFIQGVENDVTQLVDKVEQNPAVQGAASALSAAATTVATDGVQWAGTALTGVSSGLASDMSALVAKYAPQVFGPAPAGAAVTAGTMALAQQFGALLVQLARAGAADIIKAL